MKTTNNDPGSLKVGISAGEHIWKIGDRVQLAGEQKVRTVTFVMGGKEEGGGRKGDKVHLCFKAQGVLPIGEVEYELLGSAATLDQAA